MLSPSLIASLVLLIPLAIIIIYYDVRYRRIPNAYVLATLISGITINTAFGGFYGAASSLGGCALGFVLIFMLHVFGAMGAGDVKLFAAIGAVTGAQLVVPTFLVVVLTGGLLALISVARAGVVRSTMHRVLQIFVGSWCFFVLVCGVLAGVAAAISWLSVPRYAQPMWSVLAILGVLLAAIDARTSWLPLQLTRTAWLAMTVTAVLAASLGGGVWVVVRAAAGAAIGGGLYLLVWLLSRGGFGFGDVRFAPLLGAAAAADSWTLLWWTLLLGTVTGGLMGLLRLAQGRRDAFPYAPSMLVGAYAACLATMLS